MFEEAFCALHLIHSNLFPFLIGCISGLMCHMGMGKVSFFLSFAAVSCDVNNFVQEELSILTIFTS